jgi:hypothetical protein
LVFIWVWSIGGSEVKFNSRGIKNLVEDKSTELVLDVLKDNQGFFKNATGELPKGEYVADIIDCCFRSGEQYTGHIEIEYQSVDNRLVKRFPNLGAFADEDVARSNYRGLTLEINHMGGPVAARLVSPVLLDGSGKISVRFTAKDAFTQSELKSLPIDDNCIISHAHIKLMEELHLKHNIGVVVDIAGQDYVIIHQKIDGIQACVEKYGDPSFAWPTLDGQHFVGIPNSGIVSFKRVTELEEIAKSLIDVNIILFPVISL